MRLLHARPQMVRYLESSWVCAQAGVNNVVQSGILSVTVQFRWRMTVPPQIRQFAILSSYGYQHYIRCLQQVDQHGFLGSLRPFRGELREENFFEVMECLKTLKDDFAATTLEQGVVSDIVAIVHLTRVWASPCRHVRTQ